MILSYGKNFFLLLSVAIFLACSKKDQDISTSLGDKVSVQMQISSSSFDFEGDLINKTSSNSSSNPSENNQETYIDFNDDFYIKAELTLDNANLNPKLSSVSNKAAQEISSVNPNVRYKVIVFDPDGAYIDEKDYVRGQESAAESFMLNGNRNYTFIVYSINSTTSNPSVTYVNNGNKTLQTASININGQDDFMYFRRDMFVAGNVDNRINVIFKHKLSQITTVIDASETEYNISSITASFNVHNSSATVDIATGNVTRNGTVGDASVSFPVTTLNKPIATSTPTIVNASTSGTTSLKFTSITIGSFTQSNITPLNNLSVTPGAKYKLTLTLIPQDEYIDVNGIPAARIGGQVWMRHNVGANYSIEPDSDPLVSGLHGNYYQFGRIAIVASPTANATNSNWTQNNAGAAFWNTGTEAAPVKTTADPCPSGYRIPTQTEVNTLINNTVATNKGSFTTGTAQYTSAKVLTSKRKKSIILTLPAQGYFNVSGSAMSNYAPTGINERGSRGHYYTSSASGTNIYTYSFTSTGISVSYLSGNAAYRSQSKNIRCIAPNQ